MRLAVFSDIHGNAYALALVLADLERKGIDAMVCLGDAIQGGPQPKQVVDLLRAHRVPVIMGNADDWLLTGVETQREVIPEERLRKMGDIRKWSLAQLGRDDVDFIARFEPTRTIALDDKTLLCFHGSPASFEDVILPDSPYEEFVKLFGAYPNDFFTGGHTHIQYVRRVNKSFMFNPGSVGFAYSHHQPDDDFHADAVAEYAILSVSGDQTGLEFCRLAYDPVPLIEIYEASGRPYAADAIAQYTYQ